MSPNPFTPPAPSDVQTGNPVADHDPFDTRGVDSGAWHLIPLIYSNGSNAGDLTHGVNVNGTYSFAAASGAMFSNNDFLAIGKIIGVTSFGGITNHHIEQR